MEIPRHWRLKQQRYNLVGTVCSKCGEKYFPPRQVCPGCGADITQPCTFSGKGEVYTFTTIYEPPAVMRKTLPTRLLWSSWWMDRWSPPNSPTWG